MRRTVNGIVYNTATARLIGEWRNTLDIQDAKWCHEILFKTTDGVYFLWGCGGALSPYKPLNYIIRSPKAEITPLSLKEAKEWAQKYLRYAVCCKEFGKFEEVA